MLVIIFTLVTGGVIALGVWHPLWLTRWTMHDIAWISLVVSVLTLLVTITIPVLIYSLGRKGERTTHDLLEHQRGILGLQRLDVLAAQAEQMSDPADLVDILKEGRKLAQELGVERSLTRVVEAYWRNPLVPLCGSALDLDARGAQLTAQFLPTKLSGTSTLTAMRKLNEFIMQAREFENCQFTAARISDWVLSRFIEGRGPGDSQIRDMLSVSPDEMFGALLNQLDSGSRSVPIPACVDILAGACLAYLDRIGFYPKAQSTIPQTEEKSDANLQLSCSFALNLATLFHNGRLNGLAEWDAEGCSIPPDSCAALVVAASGAVSFYSAHLAMRSLEQLSSLRINPLTLGTAVDEFDFGRVKFEQYRPELLAEYW